MVAHNVIAHSNAHTLPRPVQYENKFMHVKRVFNTQPEVMGFVICVGETIHERMLKKPLMTCLLSVQAGLLLSFGILMSCQVGGRWGSSTGVNNFMFAGFGIPFGLTFIVMCQGAELITANYMFCTFAVLAAEPEDRMRQIKGLLGNWFVCWWANLGGAVLHFVVFAWSSGLMKTVAVDNDPYSDPTGSLENLEKLWYESAASFREDFNGDFCTRGNYGNANVCKVMKVCRAKCTAHFTTSIIRGAGCNWMFLIPAGIMTGGHYLDSRCNWGNAFWFNWVPVTLGSIVGAWFLVFPFWLINKDGWYAGLKQRAAITEAETKFVDGKVEDA
ncbi:phosphoprotein phosphatase [Aureococcus anophagefferens]|nr:phosphoprotein phosphatase [Aureococcus anophagefferens]